MKSAKIKFTSGFAKNRKIKKGQFRKTVGDYNKNDDEITEQKSAYLD
jgi:hypothetical protein